MPISMESIENGHILRVITADPWDMRDVQQAQITLRTHLDTVNFPVHTLMDLSGVRIKPPRVVGVHGGTMLTNPGRGYMAIFGASKLITALSGVMFRMERFRNFRMFNSEEEALAFLREIIAGEPKPG